MAAFNCVNNTEYMIAFVPNGKNTIKVLVYSIVNYHPSGIFSPLENFCTAEFTLPGLNDKQIEAVCNYMAITSNGKMNAPRYDDVLSTERQCDDAKVSVDFKFVIDKQALSLHIKVKKIVTLWAWPVTIIDTIIDFKQSINEEDMCALFTSADKALLDRSTYEITTAIIENFGPDIELFKARFADDEVLAITSNVKSESDAGKKISESIKSFKIYDTKIKATNNAVQKLRLCNDQNYNKPAIHINDVTCCRSLFVVK